LNLHGIIPPVVTPFLSDESLDLPRLKSHIDHQLSCGVHGIFVLGTTGEFYSLSEAEKQAVTAAAIEHVGTRAPVFVGTGAETTGEVVRLSKMAAKEGATGVSVITPYFLKPTQSELFDHFRQVAEVAGVPVILYNNPATCAGLSIEPDTVAKLAEVPNVIGIKDSSGDLQNTIELVKRTNPETFSVLIGRDTLILAGLLFGTRGAIPATCNIAPRLCVDIYESFRGGEIGAARAFQDKLAPVRMALSLGTGNGAVKEALALMGQSCGPNRAPIGPLGDEKRAKLKQVLSGAGLV
jgi:4-hydroxy-tetrahydrodipicolinate synthase